MLPYAILVLLVLLVFLSTQRELCHCEESRLADRGNLNPYKKPSLCKGRGTTEGGGRVVKFYNML